MRKTLSILTALALSFMTLQNLHLCQTVEIAIVERPNIDILLTTGNFVTNLDNFEEDIKTQLKKDNVYSDNVSFQIIKTKTQQVDESKVADIFATWDSYSVPFNRSSS